MNVTYLWWSGISTLFNVQRSTFGSTYDVLMVIFITADLSHLASDTEAGIHIVDHDHYQGKSSLPLPHCSPIANRLNPFSFPILENAQPHIVIMLQIPWCQKKNRPPLQKNDDDDYTMPSKVSGIFRGRIVCPFSRWLADCSSLRLVYVQPSSSLLSHCSDYVVRSMHPPWS
jgi:hypothetical protein